MFMAASCLCDEDTSSCQSGAFPLFLTSSCRRGLTKARSGGECESATARRRRDRSVGVIQTWHHSRFLVASIASVQHATSWIVRDEIDGDRALVCSGTTLECNYQASARFMKDVIAVGRRHLRVSTGESDCAGHREGLREGRQRPTDLDVYDSLIRDRCDGASSNSRRNT